MPGSGIMGDDDYGDEPPPLTLVITAVATQPRATMMATEMYRAPGMVDLYREGEVSEKVPRSTFPLSSLYTMALSKLKKKVHLRK